MLFHHVPPKMAGGFAREVALTTVEWLFSSVLACVHSQTTSCSAGIVALTTLKRFFSSMFPHMPFESGQISGRIVAHVATVELSSVIQSYLGIFFFYYCLHLHRILFVELAARLEDNCFF